MNRQNVKKEEQGQNIYFSPWRRKIELVKRDRSQSCVASEKGENLRIVEAGAKQ